VRRLLPELWRQKNWLFRHNTPSHTFFSPWNFWPKQHDCHSSPILLFSISPIVEL
jgi:hypothetical protein